MIFNLSSAILRCQCQLVQRPIAVAVILRRWHAGSNREVRWERPKPGWVKLNFDGAYKGGTGKASIGGIVRDHEGRALLGYAEPIGRRSALIAECIALKRGLELVLEENQWENVWLEGDAKTLVDIIEFGRKVKSKEVSRLVRDIKLIKPEREKWKLTHIYREGNRVADKLANMGNKLDKLCVWTHQFPQGVLRIVDEDAEGKIIIRRK